jgi:hypothetical protein
MSLKTKQRGVDEVASSTWPSAVIHKMRNNTA